MAGRQAAGIRREGNVDVGTDEGMAGQPAIDPPDFGMARFYLDRARNAHHAGNVTEFIAARSMVMVALGGKP